MVLKRMIALLLTCGTFAGVAAAPELTLRTIPTASCTTPKPTEYERRINASGTIEAKEMKEVYLETPVIARSVKVAIGDRVQKGQILAEIDTSLTKSVLEESIPSSALFSGIPIDSADAESLQGLYAAFQSAGLGGDLSSALESAAQVYGVTSGVSAPSNSYLYVPETVVAPMSGVVTDVSIKSDVLSRTSKPVVTISDTNSFVAMVTVGESYISSVRVGDSATIKGTGFTKLYTGHVSKIYPIARRAAGTAAQETVVDVEIAIDNPDSNLKSGFTARAEIQTDTHKTMLTIPYEAIGQDENNIEYVYLARGSRAVRRDIVTGTELLEGVEVTEGLSETDVLVANAAAISGDGAYISLQGGS